MDEAVYLESIYLPKRADTITVRRSFFELFCLWPEVTLYFVGEEEETEEVGDATFLTAFLQGE